MKRINLLTEETSNKIAAGEVVERPFSVVKELVENSIDASAANITIEIAEGGQKSIKILDDGTGIHPEDIEKAFLPHATSKINEVNDIYNITTMGFRGEALASISAVSNTTLRSRTGEFAFGKEISISGGAVNHIKDCAMNVGTYIEVNDLFYNVPARLKFMKSSVREGAAISDIAGRIALANSKVAIKVINNRKKVLQTFGNGNVVDCIRSIYGKSISENIIPFENHTDVASVHGYVGNSEISRGSRNNQSIFVNGRYIKSKLITAAVENACKSFLMVNKFPFFTVYLDIFPEFIDVNIHPTKSEVKFRDDREIFKLVFDGIHKAIKESLKDSFNIPVDTNAETFKAVEHESLNYFNSIDNDNSRPSNDYKLKEDYKFKDNSFIDIPIDLKPRREEIPIEDNKDKDKDNDKDIHSSDNFVSDTGNKTTINNIADINNTDNRDVYREETVEVSQNDRTDTPHNYVKEEPAKTYAETKKEESSKSEPLLQAKFPSLEVIGQFNKTYILAQAMGELYIIDQHAAHEKILFERYKSEIADRATTVQLLLTPVVIELSAEDYFYFVENEKIFMDTGFVIEIFGDNTITVREVPYILGKLNIKNFILDIIDNLKNLGSGKTVEVKYDAIARMACKSAIKANDSLSEAEIKTLLNKLRYASDPFNCPHGRPTIVKITLNELEKKFKRIQ